MNFPYRNNFDKYCKKQKKYADSTMLIVDKSINTFWQYYANGADEANLKEIQTSDLQHFFDNLETNLKLKQNTINKYISHLRLYFTFLYSHQLIDFYPMLEINGRKFSRKHTYIINWMKYLPEITQIPDLHPETIYMLLLISLGYTPEQALKVRYQEVLPKIKDSRINNYLKSHLNFEIDENPIILGKKFGGAYPSDFHIIQRVKDDRKKLGLDLTLQSLRLSYVYSLLNEGDLTDKQLMEKLQVNQKSLLNYRQNMMYYNKLKEFRLNKKQVSD